MSSRNRVDMRIVLYLSLSLVLTALMYIIGGSIYRTGLRNVYQSIIRVELTDFIENTRYALHFGKDINTFYRMNELLTEEVEAIDDLDGLYVVSSSDNKEIFATDGRELSATVLAMSDGNWTEGNQFYTSMALEENGNSRLISRSAGTEVLLGQSDFMFRFLLFCIAGFLISSAIILLTLRKRQTDKGSALYPAIVLVAWIVISSSVMNYGTYAVYRTSIGEMGQLVVNSINTDLSKVHDMGIKSSSIAPLDSFLERYAEAADEVKALSIDDSGNILVTMEPFEGRFVMLYIFITLIFIGIALAVIKLSENRIKKAESISAGKEDSAELSGDITGEYSIKRRLQRLVILISASALIIISAIAFAIMLVIRAQSETALINETKGNLTVVAFDAASLVEEKLERYEDYARFFSSVPEKSSEPILPYLSDEDNNVFRVYWGNKDGILTVLEKDGNIVEPDNGYEFRESDWYKEANKARDIIFTEVYTDNLGAGKMITCATPYYDDNGEFMGVLGIDITVSDIYKELGELNLGENSYAFIVDSTGNVITYQDGKISLEDAEGLDEDARDRLLNSDGSVFERNGIYYTGSKVFLTDWTVCIHAPAGQTLQTVQTIDNEIKTAIVIFILVFALVLLVVFFIVTNTAAGIADPIIELEKDVREISGGNLEHRARVLTNDEVGRLAGSFNEMSASLKDYIENIREMTAVQERLGAELSVATKIQADMLPSDFSKYADRKDFDVYASMTPAKEVGGDFYDFFLIDDEHLGLVMADVSGKGVPAALFMVVTRTLIKNCALTGASPAEILAKVNKEICENNEELLFVTVWIGILNLRTGVLSTSDAGHEYPAVRKKDATDYELVVTEHYAPLGTMEENEYSQFDITLEQGDTIFLYTDGATDAKNMSGEKLGIDRFMKFVNSHAAKDPKEQVELLRTDLDSYMEGADPFDDITVMCVKYLGRKDGGEL